jgi:hypothetical protein
MKVSRHSPVGNGQPFAAIERGDIRGAARAMDFVAASGAEEVEPPGAHDMWMGGGNRKLVAEMP